MVVGDHSNPVYDDTDLLNLLTGSLFLAYAVVVVVLILVGAAIFVRLRPLKVALVELENKQNRIEAPALNKSVVLPQATSVYANDKAGINFLESPVASGVQFHDEPDELWDDASKKAVDALSPKPTSPQQSISPAEKRIDIQASPDPVSGAPLPDQPAENPATSASSADSMSAKEISAKFAPWKRFHPFLLCFMSGILGAQSILFSKCFSVLLATSFSGDNQMAYFFPWSVELRNWCSTRRFYKMTQLSQILLFSFCLAVLRVCAIGMLLCIFSQLFFMAEALRYYDSMYCVPTFQTFYILISTLGGGAYFKEFNNFTTLQAAMFALGFAITILGVIVLTLRSNPSGKKKQLTVSKFAENSRAWA